MVQIFLGFHNFYGNYNCPWIINTVNALAANLLVFKV